MKNLFFATCMLFAMFAFGQKVSHVNVEVFANEMKENPGTILDVRTGSEYANGIIEGAIWADFLQDDFEEKIKKLPKDKPVYVYCAAGGRSAKAAEVLKENGFKIVVDLKGGITEWKNEKMPIQYN